MRPATVCGERPSRDDTTSTTDLLPSRHAGAGIATRGPGVEVRERVTRVLGGDFDYLAAGKQLDAARRKRRAMETLVKRPDPPSVTTRIAYPHGPQDGDRYGLKEMLDEGRIAREVQSFIAHANAEMVRASAARPGRRAHPPRGVAGGEGAAAGEARARRH